MISIATIKEPLNRISDLNFYNVKVNYPLLAQMNGIAEMILSTFAFSVMTLSVKLSSLNTSNIVLYRSIIQSFITIFSIKYKNISIEKDQYGLVLWRGLIGALEICFFYYSVQHLNIEDATIIFLSAPILTSLLGYLVLKEKIDIRNIISLILCITGSLLVAAPQVAVQMNLGVVCAIAGAITSSAVYILIRCLTCHALFSILSFNVFSILLSGSQILYSQSIQIPNDPWLLSIVIFSYIGQYYLNTALQKIPASVGTLIVNLDVVFAFFYSVLIFKNTIEWNSCAGAALVVGGSLLCTMNRTVDKSDEEAPLLENEE